MKTDQHKGVPLDDETTGRLLSYALVRTSRSVEGLVMRLEAEDGAEWFLRSLPAIPLEASSSFDAAVLEGEATPEQLLEIKAACKKLYREEQGDRRLIGVAGYFLTIAAALVNTGERISGLDPEELHETFLDLATAVPSPWSEFLAQAAVS